MNSSQEKLPKSKRIPRHLYAHEFFDTCKSIFKTSTSFRKAGHEEMINPKFQSTQSVDSSSFCTSSGVLSSSSQSLSSWSQSSFRSSEFALSKQSSRLTNLGLDLQMLESLLCVKSIEYCSDGFFINEMFQRFSGIATKRKHLTKPFDHDELEGIADALKDLLHHSPIMPLTLVAKVHSTIGIIHQMMGENDYALNAFTKALYLHTKAVNPDILEVGLLMSRIGVLRKRKGDHDVAFKMLLRALQIYKLQGVNENHTYYLATKIELQGIRSCLRISHSNDT